MSFINNENALKAQNKKSIIIISFIVLFMLSLSFAAVPLYDIFCRVTGFGGTTQIASTAPGSTGHPDINVRFESNTSSSKPLTSFPNTKAILGIATSLNSNSVSGLDFLVCSTANI